MDPTPPARPPSGEAQVSGVFVGLATLDLVYRVERAPEVDEKVRATSQELVAGGPAANAAVAYAALAGRATLATVLGEHPLAAVAAADLAAHDVHVLDAGRGTRTPPPVATAVVVESTGERSVVSVGAAGSPAEPTAELADAVRSAAVLLLDGHHPRLALAAARVAQDAGVPVVLDAGSWKPVLTDLLPLVDVAACSAGFRVPERADTVAALHGRGVRRVAVTQGGGPVRWSADGVAGEVGVGSVEVRDTLGAGDAFHGALAWALATRPDAAFEDQLRLAAGVATLRCAHEGQRAWLGSLGLAGLRTGWL